MSDRRIRVLEHAAAAGDPEARARVLAELERTGAGECSVLGGGADPKEHVDG